MTRAARGSRRVEAFGFSLTVYGWAAFLGLKEGTLYSRYWKGARGVDVLFPSNELPKEKTCIHCTRTLPAECFYPTGNKRSRAGARKTTCKECDYAAFTTWRKTNKDKWSALEDRHRARNNERSRKRSQYHATNLTDEYIVKIALKVDWAPPELIASKRAHILVHRFIKENK